ncbi:spore gernimation protein [Bacillus methanolicus]|uniref:Ger(x)C family spore germination protein n=1 Tax=Bacillus methanolicus TaxID=1471 RepID=UPI00237FE096|nr:Ger(x)C family spore germination protein [Bacillus methanolicus]MDE3839198.1 spore gernimation protein [Bacillus methanolicus]
MGQMKQILLITLVTSMMITAGCSPFLENNMIEEIAPITFWYTKEGEEGQFKMTTLMPPLLKEKKNPVTIQANLVRQGAKKFNYKYFRELKAGQIRLLFIDEDFAKKGIMQLINLLSIDPDISQRLYVVIVKGDFEEYITNQVSRNENIDYFLYLMFKHYEKKRQGEMTVINIHQFMENLYSPFSDPILPVFKVDKDNFKYEGTAIFNHDKLIATVKNVEENIVQLIDNAHYLKFLPIEPLSVVLDGIRSNVHMDLNRNFSSLTIKVEMSGRIMEYLGNKNIFNEDELAELKKDIEMYLEKQTFEFIKKLQKWGVDPFQIGKHSKTPFAKPLSEKQWLKYWEQMDINVDYSIYIQPLLEEEKNK